MKQERSLKKNFLFIAIGNLFYTLTQYLLLILFIKYLNKDDVGGYLYALAFATPLVQPLEMQLRSLFITDRSDNFKLSDYHSLRIISNSVSLILIIFGAYIFKQQFFEIILIIGFIKIIESQMDISYASFQRNDYLYYISYSKIIRGIITLILVFLLIINAVDLIIILYSWMLIWILLFITLDVKWTKKIDKTYFDLKKYFIISNLIRILKISWPLFFLDFVDKYYVNYPNLFVESKFGLKMVAIFGSILYFRAIGGQLIAPISNVTAPRLAEFWSDDALDKFKILLYKIVGIALLIGISGVLVSFFLGEWALTFLFTIEYAKYNQILIYIMVISTVSYSYIFLGTALTCMRKHWVKLPIHLLAFGLLLIVSNYFNLDINNFMILLLRIELLIALLYLLTVVYFFRKKKVEIVLINEFNKN